MGRGCVRGRSGGGRTGSGHGATNEEFRREPQYTDVLSKMPLITVEKIGESEPVPLKANGNLPLSGVRALGMGHVIAGAGIGRDMALYGADVLNVWNHTLRKSKR